LNQNANANARRHFSQLFAIGGAGGFLTWADVGYDKSFYRLQFWANNFARAKKLR
jgi:hypothetical protein